MAALLFALASRAAAAEPTPLSAAKKEPGSGGVSNGGATGGPAAATALMPLPWGEVLQHRLTFLIVGQGYTIHWKALPDGAGAWSWVAASDSLNACQYRAVITTDPAMKKPVRGCESSGVQGVLRASTQGKGKGGAADCALRGGDSYYLHFYLTASHTPSASMAAAGKTTCVSWLAHNGKLAQPD